MPNSKSILKILFALGVWSFVVIGLVKIHTNNIVLEDYPAAPMSGRLLLQKESKFNMEATSTTTDRILPLDVLVDSRQGEYACRLGWWTCTICMLCHMDCAILCVCVVHSIRMSIASFANHFRFACFFLFVVRRQEWTTSHWCAT